jgi:pyridinium-3,5-biscarboxylic acid mononucleotide sulfurtransferase
MVPSISVSILTSAHQREGGVEPVYSTMSVRERRTLAGTLPATSLHTTASDREERMKPNASAAAEGTGGAENVTPSHPAAGSLIDRLADRLRAEQRVIIGYSGGADSAFLAAMGAQVLGASALAVTAVSPSLPRAERVAAREFARAHGIRHLEVCTDEQDRPEYVVNDGNRCYHCKSALFDALRPLSELLGASVALGTNLDDIGDYRPGQRAAAERGVISPLVDVGFTKQDVRDASRRLGLETADKPAAACLASRVAYGDEVTPELLSRVEAAEDAVRALGFSVCRVRAHAGGTVARLEVPADDIDRAVTRRAALDAALRAAGFRFVALDLAGFSSGRLNILLTTPVPARDG